MRRDIIDISGNTIHEHDMYGEEICAGDILGMVTGGGRGGFYERNDDVEFVSITLWKMPNVHRGGGTDTMGIQVYEMEDVEFWHVDSSRSWLIRSSLIKKAFKQGKCSFDIEGGWELEDKPKGHTQEIEGKIERAYLNR